MDEQQEREKLLSFGLTEDVIEIVIAKKRTLERQKSCVIIADPIPIPIPIPEPIDIIPVPEPEIPVVEIKEQEEHIVEIKQETKIYTGMPVWKRRLSQRNNK